MLSFFISLCLPWIDSKSKSEPLRVFRSERSIRSNKRLVPVVLDPLVAATLRPHQKEGVQFLYDCMIGQKVNDLMCYGCILADEMYTSIALLYYGTHLSLVGDLVKQFNP